MPRDVKGTPEEREKFMFDTFTEFYSKPENAGKDLSVAKANEIFKKKFGSMLRNKRSYQIRAAAMAQVKGHAPKVTKAARQPMTTAPGGKQAACLIEGTPEQVAWLREKVLPQLQQSGLATAKVDHSTEAYAVIARA